MGIIIHSSYPSPHFCPDLSFSQGQWPFAHWGGGGAEPPWLRHCAVSTNRHSVQYNGHLHTRDNKFRSYYQNHELFVSPGKLCHVFMSKHLEIQLQFLHLLLLNCQLLQSKYKNLPNSVSVIIFCKLFCFSVAITKLLANIKILQQNLVLFVFVW